MKIKTLSNLCKASLLIGTAMGWAQYVHADYDPDTSDTDAAYDQENEAEDDWVWTRIWEPEPGAGEGYDGTDEPYLKLTRVNEDPCYDGTLNGDPFTRTARIVKKLEWDDENTCPDPHEFDAMWEGKCLTSTLGEVNDHARLALATAESRITVTIDLTGLQNAESGRWQAGSSQGVNLLYSATNPAQVEVTGSQSYTGSEDLNPSTAISTSIVLNIVAALAGSDRIASGVEQSQKVGDDWTISAGSSSYNTAVLAANARPRDVVMRISHTVILNNKGRGNGHNFGGEDFTADAKAWAITTDWSFD